MPKVTNKKELNYTSANPYNRSQTTQSLPNFIEIPTGRLITADNNPLIWILGQIKYQLNIKNVNLITHYAFKLSLENKLILQHQLNKLTADGTLIRIILEHLK